MFNRGNFNQAKFNASSDAHGYVSGAVALRLTTAGKIGRIRPVAGTSPLNLSASCKPTLIRPLPAQTLEMRLGAQGKVVRKRPLSAQAAALNLTARADYHAFGTEEFALPGLIVRPGDELVIDTDLMTVTLNGVNIARYVRMNSQFIKLLAAGNTFVYQDKSGATRKADVRVEWKPRWL
jgi:hypothetical protein